MSCNRFKGVNSLIITIICLCIDIWRSALVFFTIYEQAASLDLLSCEHCHKNIWLLVTRHYACMRSVYITSECISSAAFISCHISDARLYFRDAERIYSKFALQLGCTVAIPNDIIIVSTSDRCYDRMKYHLSSRGSNYVAISCKLAIVFV